MVEPNIFEAQINEHAVFQDELLERERVVWTGKPDPNIIFGAEDWFMIPFSIFWTGFSLVWEAAACGMFFVNKHSGTNTIPSGIDLFTYIFPLFGLPFVLIGLYLLFGRFIYKHYLRKKTFYAVTDQRVIIVTTLGNKNMRALELDKIEEISKTVNSTGRGTLVFGISTSFINYDSRKQQVGGVVQGNSFNDIPDATGVHKEILTLRETVIARKKTDPQV
ncbi:MAG: hypothetical protein WC955_00440 [Elusimicrobiota bacterium]